MVANSALELNDALKVISMAPKPTTERIISPVTMPSTARPMPRRMPAITIGMAAGRIILKNNSLSRAPKERAISVKVGSTLRTPAVVLIVIITNAKRKTIHTREWRPRPKAITRNGINEIIGTASSAVM